MTRDETRALLALAAATTRDWAPNSVDTDAWHGLLGDLEFDDCREALLDHCRRSHHRPVPADVRAGVKRVRADRLERAPYVIPAADPDDPQAYLRALRSGTARTAGGEQPRDLRQLEQVFPAVPPAGPRPAGVVAHVTGRAAREMRAREARGTEPLAIEASTTDQPDPR